MRRRLKSRRKFVKRRTKRSFKRRSFRRRSNTGSTMKVRTPNIIADRTYVKLKYRTRIPMANASGVVNTYQFRGNSPYDPDYTSTGAQPSGWDQWSAFYQYYSCAGSSIKVEFGNVGTSAANQNFENHLYPTPDVLVPTTIDDVGALPYDKKTLTYFGQTRCVMKHYMTTRKIQGLTKIQAGDLDFDVPVTSNPPSSEQWYWNISTVPIDRSSNGTQYAYVTLTYYICFNKRFIQNLS